MDGGLVIPTALIYQFSVLAAGFIGWVAWNMLQQKSKITESSVADRLNEVVADIKKDIATLGSKAELMIQANEQSVLAVKERVRKLEETYLAIPMKFEAIQSELKAQQLSQASYYTTKSDLKEAFEGTKSRLNKLEEAVARLDLSVAETQRLMLQHMQESAAAHREEMARATPPSRTRSKNG